MFVTDILFQTEENVLAHESTQNMGFHWRYFYVVERYFRKILKICFCKSITFAVVL